MITYIEVNGFRSLSGFTFSVRPGLNVLVGPNGAGKTNILSFFEFLGDLTRHGLSQAIAKAGGAASVFRKESENAFSRSVSAKVRGYCEISSREYLHYDYDLKFELIGDPPTPRYTSQCLLMQIRTVATETTSLPAPDIRIEMTRDGDKVQIRVPNVTSRFKKKCLDERFFGGAGRRSTVATEVQRWLGYFAEQDDSMIPGIDRLLSYGLARRTLYADLAGGVIYNVVPSRARVEEDLASTPGIAKDGSGLYSTLYALSRFTADSSHRPQTPRFTSSVSLKFVKESQVHNLLQLANPAIEKLVLSSDTFDNKLMARVHFKAQDAAITVLPLSTLSDGTIKWLSLVLVTLASESMFSVEEPENYLHPRLQREFLELVRTTVKGKRAVLLSTHSQTLIDQCNPREVVVVQFRDNRTVASRPDNPETLDTEIETTGFGLGHYYVTGALDPLPELL